MSAGLEDGISFHSGPPSQAKARPRQLFPDEISIEIYMNASSYSLK